jgi:hypothetical protein
MDYNQAGSGNQPYIKYIKDNVYSKRVSSFKKAFIDLLYKLAIKQKDLGRKTMIFSIK